jgi:threonine dehydratase
MVTLVDVQAAQQRLAASVRRTPMLNLGPARQPLGAAGQVQLKLECLQVTGSFKVRGAMNTVLTSSAAQLQGGLVTASGGNHGLGVAYAGYVTKTPTTVYLPRSTPEAKAEKLRSWGATVRWEGEVWDEANHAALQAAEREGMMYVHPFADPRVIAGQGTLGLEIIEQAPELDVLVVAIGGGGLISGVAIAAHAHNPKLRVIGVEPIGAPTLYRSVQAGRVIELPAVHTAAGTLAPRKSAQLNFDLIREHVAEIVLVSDDQMRAAAQWLYRECGVAAELSGAAAVAALLSETVPTRQSERVCAIVCGAGSDGI